MGDTKTMTEAREVFRRVDGRRPFALPLPTFLFRRFISEDLVLMWEWLATHEMPGDRESTRALVPGARDLESWLGERRRRP